MSDSNKKQFLGRWKLECCVGKSGDKRFHPIGEDPFGMLTYTAQYMMVFISSGQRARFSTDDIRAIPAEQVMADFPKFETYCGQYGIDDDKKIVTHFIENGKIPNQIGTEFRRYFSFQNEKLVLESTDELMLNGEPWLFELVWSKQESL
ncbi:MAG: lipocalin-like domain-containing protein [Pseudomonadota bacterium]